MSVKVHAIQTGSVSIKEAQRSAEGRDSQRLLNVLLDKDWTPYLPIYCWLIEHPNGLVMVDTGETARTTQSGYFPAWHPFFRNVRTKLTADDEVGPQLRQLGFDPDDVRYVVMTHMHTDHAGGLQYFPNATFLLSQAEYAATQGIGGRIAGYLPQHWPEWFAPTLIDFEHGPLASFEQSYALLDGITLLPTPGHAAGHLSVFVETAPQPIVIAGDVSYSEAQLYDQALDGVAPDAVTQRETLKQMLALVQATNALYLPSHDPHGATRLQRVYAAQKNLL